MYPAQFSVSLMCMDFMQAERQLNILNTRADAYHMDIMDGHFAPNLALTPGFVQSAGTRAGLPMEAHLMTDDPHRWLRQLAEAGARTLSVHYETITRDTFRTLDLVRELGCNIGLVLNPGTPLCQVAGILGRVDLLTLMTVDTGFARQPFIPEMLKKVEEAAARRASDGHSYRIQTDGACNAQTFGPLRQAGAEVFVLGRSGLFDLSPDLTVAWDAMVDGYQHATGEQIGVC